MPFLGASHDLFGDGSLRLVNLPGHARGQIGLLAHTAQGDDFFVADGAWLSRAIREERPPAHTTKLIVDDWGAVQRTLLNLHAFAQAQPTWRLIPTHCPEVFARDVEPSR